MPRDCVRSDHTSIACHSRAHLVFSGHADPVCSLRTCFLELPGMPEIVTSGFPGFLLSSGVIEFSGLSLTSDVQ